MEKIAVQISDRTKLIILDKYEIGKYIQYEVDNNFLEYPQTIQLYEMFIGKRET
jgi:hypothetical protein